MDKNLTGYSGKVEITINTDATTQNVTASTKIWISNKSYQYVNADCNGLLKETTTSSTDAGNKMIQSKDTVSATCN